MAPEAVGSEVEPVATPIGGAVGLKQFDAAAEQHRAKPRSAEGVKQRHRAATVGTQELQPQHPGKAEVHAEMHNLVNVGNGTKLGRWRLEERQIDNSQHDSQRKGIFSEIIEHTDGNKPVCVCKSIEYFLRL